MATGYPESEDRSGTSKSVLTAVKLTAIKLQTYRGKNKDKVIKPPHNPSHLTTATHTVRATQWPPLA